MKPKVSVIVPCYKVEKYLDRCVESLVNQTLRDIEIILVDDGSPDRVPQMCDDWAAKDSRIKVVHKKNGGLGMACNSGIDVACGDYIAFVDSDDYLDLDCYECLYDYAISNDVDAVYSGIKRVDDNGEVSPMSQALEVRIFENESLTDFKFGMIASPPGALNERERQMSAKIVLYSGRIIRDNDIRFHSERQFISEDLLFNLDFLSKCVRVMEVPNTFYYYYVNATSLSRSFRPDRFDRYKDLRDYLLSHYEFMEFNNDYRCRVNKLFVGYVRSGIRKIVQSKQNYKTKMDMIKFICDDDYWNKIWCDNSLHKETATKRLIQYLIRRKLYLFLYLIYR